MRNILIPICSSSTQGQETIPPQPLGQETHRHISNKLLAYRSKQPQRTRSIVQNQPKTELHGAMGDAPVH